MMNDSYIDSSWINNLGKQEHPDTWYDRAVQSAPKTYCPVELNLSDPDRATCIHNKWRCIHCEADYDQNYDATTDARDAHIANAVLDAVLALQYTDEYGNMLIAVGEVEQLRKDIEEV